jgi:sugar transferase (PEP-CTERM/EpsH1 system associated)
MRSRSGDWRFFKQDFFTPRPLASVVYSSESLVHRSLNTQVKILYIAHRVPYPPNKGEKIRTFHQIQQLAKNHTIHLCAFVDDPDDVPHVSSLRKYCASVEVAYRGGSVGNYFHAAVGFLRGLPLSISLFHRHALAKKVLQKVTTERFDCIIGSSSLMAQYVSLCSNIPKILDFIDVDSEKWRSYAQRRSFPLSFIYRLEAERLARYEKETAQLSDHCFLVSEEEKCILQRRVNGHPVSVISNGVDIEYFSPSGDVRETSQPAIVFTGVMDYFPNVDAVRYFCRDMLPLVLRTMPTAQFNIVGRNPTRQVRELGKHANVVVTGAVADVRPYLAQASVSIAPFRLARGVQNKILESMAMGVPVVGTTQAFKGIAATEQHGIRIADDPRSFAQHVLTLLQGDVSLRRQAGFQARRFVERHHRWEDQGANLERLIEDVVRKHRQKQNDVYRRDAEYAE